MPDLVGDLALGEDHEDSPEVIPIVQSGESSRFDAAAEAIEGPQRRVLRVADGLRGASEPLAGQIHEFLEITLPQRLGGAVTARLQIADPGRDRPLTLAGHRLAPFMIGIRLLVDRATIS